MAQPDQHFFAPEVIQTSAMDCGPAALKCLLEGFGVGVDYGRLREACQTDVDGSSIDMIQAVAEQLGLNAEQVITPLDHLLLPAAHNLPALVVTALPTGQLHFIVVWRCFGPWVQVMDPAQGRRWLSIQQLHALIYQHHMPMAADVWLAWARSDGFCAPLRARLAKLELSSAQVDHLVTSAGTAASWLGPAALDAATRLVEAVVAAQGVARGEPAARLVEQFFTAAQQSYATAYSVIPASFWSVQPLLRSANAQAATSEEQLLMYGAVIIRVLGRHSEATAPQPAPTTAESPGHLSPALMAALRPAATQPAALIWQLLRADGHLTPLALGSGLLLAAVGITFEAILFRGLLIMVTQPANESYRNLLFALCLTLALLLLLLEAPLLTITQRLGRRVESWLRIAFLEKLPRMADRYFRSRLVADMAQRAHTLRHLRGLPTLGVRVGQLGFQLLFTAAGVIWLAPASTGLVICTAAISAAFAWYSKPLANEFDQRLRTLSSALSHLYLDALKGLVPIRSHGAERALRREQELRLVAWMRAGLTFYRFNILLQIGQALCTLGPTVWIVWQYATQATASTDILLLLYWTLSLSNLSQALATTIQQYPPLRNRLLGVLELLDAPEEEAVAEQVAAENQNTRPASARSAIGSPTTGGEGVTIQLAGVKVQAGGQTILPAIDCTIAPGEHVAIVGPSGAGKSTLVGLLLGWHQPAAGQLLVDGEPLNAQCLANLRQNTAWVDPNVQLWNRSLLDNLRYGLTQPEDASVETALAAADLYTLLAQLPNGLQTTLGEGGALVSGGEGQRVRLGRALLRPAPRLVILDEPFRGLDRTQRHELLAQARRQWRAATLLCITHDVSETQSFDRVLVMENGQIVETGTPTTLAENRDSRYATLLAAELVVQQTLWSQPTWRRLWLEQGRLRETS